MNTEATEIADGSYFTDYVHYIAISNPGLSLRAVTRDLLARLLRPTEMSYLIQKYGGKTITTGDMKGLEEELIAAFGWRQTDEVREKPLAGCINGSGATTLLADNLGGNELRIVLESFCKDSVDVVVTKLGYDYFEIWRAIQVMIPEYRVTSRTKNWDEEIQHLTVGGAVMLLSALAPLAFQTRADEVNEFIGTLRKLSDILNQYSHHQEGQSVSFYSLSNVPVLIRLLLDKAEAFMGELPWHMETSFVYGEQPKVLSGEAWSHGSATPRLLRVIVWTGKSHGRHVTFWNTTRKNPVVPDPVFIQRPARHHA